MEYDKEICEHLLNGGYLDFIKKNSKSTYGKWVMRNKNNKKTVSRIFAKFILDKDIPTWLQVDHIDRNPSNNRLVNLRFATTRLNCNNKENSSFISECEKEGRFDYGDSAYGNRIKSPSISNKTPEQIEMIGKHFHHMICGEDFYEYDVEAEKEFYSIFKSQEHRDSWEQKYYPRIKTNKTLIANDKYLIEEYTGYTFGTNFYQIYLDK